MGKLRLLHSSNKKTIRTVPPDMTFMSLMLNVTPIVRADAKQQHFEIKCIIDKESKL